MSAPEWLAAEKVPFIVTILAAALGWTGQRAVTVLTEAPTIAYSVKDRSENGVNETIATIENISRTHKFGGLKFYLQAQKDGVFASTGHVVRPFAPAMQPTDAFQPKSSPKGSDVSFPVPVIQPGWKFELYAKRNSSDPTVLTVEADKVLPPIGPGVGSPAINPDLGSPVRMVEMGFTTWIVKHEICLLFCLIGLWLLAMIVSLRLLPVKTELAQPPK